MSSKRNHHSKQFKLDAINYRNEHPDFTQVECFKNLVISVRTLAKWESQFRNNDGDIPVYGSENYQSFFQKLYIVLTFIIILAFFDYYIST